MLPPPPPPHAPLVLFAPYGVWRSTQPGKKKKPTRVGGGKAVYFVRPEIWFRSSGSWKTKSKRRGRAGRQAGNRRTDFSVSANSLNNLQPPTEVSPFVTFWLREAAAQWSQMKSPCELWATLLTAEWTWDIRFQSFLHWFFCAHRFNRTPASFALFITTSAAQTFRGELLCGILLRRGRSVHIAVFARFKSEVGFPPSSEAERT